ncbi:ankyrin repeat-containing domain protein [Flagelloscypha sp. PMI_526]|nr:ankyrin repeat-containing domain protein [Flagelloscypha sp. PMI_526]
MYTPPTLEPGNGLRVLSLDGPDFNAFPQAELFFLQGIAHRWAYDEDEEEERDVRVSEMFDIVGGSGIGGFYAILFTALNMTIGQVILCHKILEDRLLSSPLWAGNDREGCSRLLDEALKEMQSQTGVSVELDSPFRSQTSTKCFVLVQNNNHGRHPRALRNYRVRTVPSSSCTIRQVLHTTLADLEHLPPVVIQDEYFASAGMRFPNPSRELVKELAIAFPKVSHLACLINVGAGMARLMDDSETVAQDLLSQCKDVECFFRLSMKNAPDAGVHVRGTVMELLQEEEISQLTDIIVETFTKRCEVIPLRRLVNIAGEDARTKRDAQMNAIHLNVKRLRDAQDGSSFRRLKDWLKPIEQVGKLESSNRTRGPTTCKWFLEHPIIEEWIQTGGVCWFHGGMGTGKTFIMSHLIQTMICQGYTVAYYYFEFTNPSTLSEEALLRSLVFQLSSIHLQTSLALYEKHRGGASEPQLAILLDCIVELAGQSKQPFYVVIDALDELPLPQRKQLFKTLEPISTVNSPNMHVIVSSRDEIDITSGLGDLAQHKLDVLHGKVRHDIAVFVDQGLSDEKWKDWPPDLIERMRIVLNERAAGQFRMVACQLELLYKTETIGDLEARLFALPKKLADTYQYILDHLIPKEERVRAQTLLRLLTVAFEVVPLDELSALIAVDLGDPSDVTNLPKYEEQQRFRQPQNIVGLGTAFVRLTTWDSGSYLQLSHASVKEYLLQQNPVHWCYMNEQLAHSTMAGACLALLLHNVSSQPDAPIGKYVRQRWFQHVKPNSSDQLLKQQIMFFEKFPWTQKTQLELDEHHVYRPKVSRELINSCPLIAASAAGLDQILPVILATTQRQDDLEQALYVAAVRGVSINVIKLLVENGADLNKDGGEYGSALQAAAENGALDVVGFLVEKGADVNKGEGHYGSALQAAARNGSLDVVEFLVEKGADVNKGEGHYGSALQAAARNGSLDVVEYLVEKGADVNKGEAFYGSALQAAAGNGALDIVKFLVEKDADVNDGGGLYGSALQAAAQNGHLDVVEFLVEKGADVNKEGGEYGSALQAAAGNGALDVVEFLVEKGADVNKGEGHYGSALQAAARNGSLDVVEFLVEKGADVNKGEGNYGSAVQAAAGNGSWDVVEFLVEKGADVNKGEAFYGSALQAAAKNGALDMVKFLVEKGADVNEDEGDHGSALQVAAGNGALDMVKFLVENGADVNKGEGFYGSALQAAAENGSWDVVEFLVEKGADVNKGEAFCRSALQAAAGNGALDMVKFLVENGADVNKGEGFYGSALQAAAENGSWDVVEYLVEKGADVNKGEAFYGSALQAAAKNGALDMVKFLVEKGADVNDGGRLYGSALQAAAQNGHLDVVEFLVEKGADVNKEGREYGSALQAATQNGHLDVVEFLIEKGADGKAEGGNIVATPSSARNRIFVPSVVSSTLGLHAAHLHNLSSVCLKGMLHMSL